MENIEKNIIEEKPVTKFEILQFGFGGFAINASMVLSATYLTFFFTDIAKISALFAGMIALVVRLMQVPLYPILGGLYDRTRTKWGKYRPYMIIVPPFFMVFSIMLYTVPSLGGSSKLAYFAMADILSSLAYMAMGLSVQSSIPILSSDRSTRNFSVMSKQVLGIIGQLAATSAVLPLVAYFGNNAGAWQKVSIVYQIVIVLCMFICANGTKRHDVISDIQVAKKQKVKLKDQLEVLKVNKPLALLVLAYFFAVIQFQVAAGTSMYFYKFVVGQQSLMSKIPAIQIPFSIAIGFAMPFLFKKGLSKRFAFMLILGVNFIYAFILLVFRPFSDPSLLLTLAVSAAVLGGTGIIGIVGWGLLPDCIDYAEWKTGKRSDSLLTSCLSAGMNIGIAIGGFIPGIVLGAAGYVGGIKPTQHILDVIVYTMTLFPIACTIIAFICLLAFPITDKFYNKMIIELNEQRRLRQVLK